MAEKVEIPDELKMLCPETQKKVIVIGGDGYMLYPLTEGQAERLSTLITDIMTDIMTQDVECPKCHEVYSGALGKKQFCSKCKGKIGLVSLQKSPIEAMINGERVPRLIEELIGVPLVEVKKSLTIPQFKHLAGVLYEQNFKDEGVVPEDSKKNLTELMKWIGVGSQASPLAANIDMSPLDKSMNHSPTSTDLPESTSKENGEPEKTEKDG